jgi:hypothetical protein
MVLELEKGFGGLIRVSPRPMRQAVAELKSHEVDFSPRRLHDGVARPHRRISASCTILAMIDAALSRARETGAHWTDAFLHRRRTAAHRPSRQSPKSNRIKCESGHRRNPNPLKAYPHECNFARINHIPAARRSPTSEERTSSLFDLGVEEPSVGCRFRPIRPDAKFVKTTPCKVGNHIDGPISSTPRRRRSPADCLPPLPARAMSPPRSIAKGLYFGRGCFR